MVVVVMEVMKLTGYTLSYCGAMRQTLVSGHHSVSLEPGACHSED